MASWTHEQRIVSRVRDIYCGRSNMEWCAESCGISFDEFQGYCQQYMGRLYFSLQDNPRLIIKEWEYLIISGHMRPNVAAKRFLGDDSPENVQKIERWIEEKGGINENLSWRDMRIIRTLQKKEEKTDGKN